MQNDYNTEDNKNIDNPEKPISYDINILVQQINQKINEATKQGLSVIIKPINRTATTNCYITITDGIEVTVFSFEIH